MSSPNKVDRLRSVVGGGLLTAAKAVAGFFVQNWRGTAVIAAATLLYFAPFIGSLTSYSPGGDAMFNAWTLARDQNCILGNDCPDITDGNIYYPHQDTMLYSEVQLSAGLLTLPLHFINDNPLFSYGVWTILGFFFSGWFMYLLAKRLSGGRELIAIVVGLIFAFAPVKVIAFTHLQNFAIFYLPLIMLLLIRYLDTARRRYLVGMFIAMVLLFYASWYQMVFSLIAVGVFLLALLVFRALDWRQLLTVGAVTAAAVVCVMPLAVQYMQFSDRTGADFKMSAQVLYSSSVADYVIPPIGQADTASGRLYETLFPEGRTKPYNLDGASYHGLVLYTITTATVVASVIALRREKKQKKKTDISTHTYVWAFTAVAVVGFVFSFGPALKLTNTPDLGSQFGAGMEVAVAMPWLLVDLILPQITFIRAIGRITVVMLFGMLCILALMPLYLERLKWRPRYKRLLLGAVIALLAFELMPLRQLPMCRASFCNNIEIPGVYRFIKEREEIDKLVILRTMEFHKGSGVQTRMEDVLWAGYHNRNIFNGYSGYEPPQYRAQLKDFVDLKANDLPKMRQLGLKYVIIDKKLSKRDASLIKNAAKLLPHRLYEDEAHVLYRL